MASSGRRRTLARTLAALVTAGLAVVCVACRSHPPAEPVSADASTALFEARLALRVGGPEARGGAEAAARRALALAPDWVAPQRVLDDLARAELAGVEALARRRAELDERPGDARLLYLAGRLEGEDGAERFERALEIDPGLAWVQHGLAWYAQRRGRLGEAIARGREAYGRARDPWERTYFTSALARYMAAAGDREGALELLEARLAETEVDAIARVELAVQSTALALVASRREVRAAAYRRGLEMVRGVDLVDAEVRQLVDVMRRLGSRDDPEELQLLGALAARSSPARDALRADLLLERDPSPLALALLERSERDGREPTAGPLMRAARFAAARFEEAVETWLADLPVAVLGADGLPRDEATRAVVHATRRLVAEVRSAPRGADEPFGSADGLAELGDALITAGWFREARSVAGWLAAQDLERALAIEDAAVSGRDLLQTLRRSSYALDLDGASGLASATEPSAAVDTDEDGRTGAQPTSDSLEGLITGWAPAVARANVHLGGETDEEEVQAALLGSPRLSYGPIGSLLHPGPRFSERDQAVGRGTAATRVPGLAAEMDRIGRFALVGEVLGGGGPDVAVLARVEASERAGEHLGVPWQGTVVWCEGADVLGRASRRGVPVAGAALHEGYWVDLQVLREDLARWAVLQRSFEGPDATAALTRVFSTRGFPVAVSGGRATKRGLQERTSLVAPLGEASRVRLTVLRDRAPAGAPLGTMTLDEVARVTAAHEEGHLTDRTRFLPIGRNLGAALRLLADAGFSPNGVMRLLEYRAQLVALCVLDDPRLALAQVLDAVEYDDLGVTQHGSAYRELAEDLVATLGRELEADPDAWPEIDGSRTLVHQLHRLGPERVRGIARTVAARRGLAR